MHNNYLAKGGTYKLLDSNGKVVRTGRTKNLVARKKAHSYNSDTKGLKFKTDRRTDDYAAQRGREQIIYDRHPEARLENGGLNKIRAIRANHLLLEKYLGAGRELN
ncbi:MAG: hypothetical protein P1V19_08085 [Gimesia sp.]|nr:hypothetical protein [Gimesia sp.]